MRFLNLYFGLRPRILICDANVLFKASTCALCKMPEFEDCVGEAEGPMLVLEVGSPCCYSISILTK